MLMLRIAKISADMSNLFILRGSYIRLSLHETSNTDVYVGTDTEELDNLTINHFGIIVMSSIIEQLCQW